MNIYKISQDVNNDWDTYDSAVVVANSDEEACKIHPSGLPYMSNWYTENNNLYSSWCKYLEDVKVEYIGEADETLEAGTIICASFNAG